MGTRADFYIKKGNKMEWLGSIAWDGYGVAEQNDEDEFSPNDKKNRTNAYIEFLINQCKDPDQYVEMVNEYLTQRKDGTKPDMGWPWPWDNSKLTDRCYVFDADSNQLLHMIGHDGDYDNHETMCDWVEIHTKVWDDEGDKISGLPVIKFTVPDMKAIKNPQYGGDRSGIILIQA